MKFSFTIHNACIKTQSFGSQASDSFAVLSFKSGFGCARVVHARGLELVQSQELNDFFLSTIVRRFA